MILKALKSYLQARGYRNVFRNILPDLPDTAVALYLLDAVSSVPSDGSVVSRIKAVIREKSLDEANLTAITLVADLDSGPDERVLQLLASTAAVCRPVKWPVPIQRDEKGRALLSCEFDVWNINN